MDPILQVKDLKTYFFLDEGTVRAVDGVSFDVLEGKTLGIVGESGSGKSVIGQSILRIVPHPGRIVEGEILLRLDNEEGDGRGNGEILDLTKLRPMGSEARSIRGGDVAMIFQEPMNSFSPVHTIGSQIIEALRLHSDVSKAEARNRSIEMLTKVGIPRPEVRINSYPHELSGGMRQRAMIAMALVCNPRVLIADEPTTALDVTVQAQILELLRSLQDEFGMAIIFISHNLGVIAETCHDVLVVYFGKVMEMAGVDELFGNPAHPYTKALLKSVPGIETPVRSALATIEGTLPDPHAKIKGCPFAARCSECAGVGDCRDVAIDRIEVGEGHYVSCSLLC